MRDEMAPSEVERLVEGPDPRYSFPMPAWFYILRLRSGALYVGATTNLSQLNADHRSGRAWRTTRHDPPVALIYSEALPTFSDARQRESQIKRRSQAKKKALAAGDRTVLRNLPLSHDQGA